jgi:hypothetical protein
MISKPALTSREIRFSTQSPSHSDRLAAIFQAMDGLASWRGNAESLELSVALRQAWISVLSLRAAVPNGPSWYTAAPTGEKVNGANGSASMAPSTAAGATPVVTWG